MKKSAPFLAAAVICALPLIGSCGGKNEPAGPGGGSSFTLSGRVLENGGGLSGVSVGLTGAGRDMAAATGPTGSFAFDGLPKGTYTVTPAKTGYRFSPAETSASISSRNVTLPDIAGARVLTAFSISGRVMENTTGLSGVAVRLVGAAKDTTVVTSSTGDYLFTGLPNGAYTLTPAKSGSIFSPSNRNVTVSDKNITVAAFSVTVPRNEKIIAFVSIPGGTFRMGDDIGDLKEDCRPVHDVTVSPFEMSTCEITNAQYAKFLNEALASGDITMTGTSVKGHGWLEYLFLSGTFESPDPDNRCWITFDGAAFGVVPGMENRPVVYVTWSGAKAFAERYEYDLPTEAEWEYACRGGRHDKFGTDDGTISAGKANFSESGIGHPVDTGGYAKNPFGLSDMSGNVWEWCRDWYGAYSRVSETNPSGPASGSYRVLRGGSWYNDSGFCRSAVRYYFYPNLGLDKAGFRVVRRK